MKSKYNPLSPSLLGFSRLLVGGFCVGSLAFAPSTWADTVSYNTPGTVDWTVPANVSAVTIELRGGGGAGGAAVSLDTAAISNLNVRAGGGAGGNYAKKVNFPVTPGTVYKVTVGAGGISPASGPYTVDVNSQLAEQTGGSSSFKSQDGTTTHALATGGVGGKNAVRFAVVNQGGVNATSSGSLGDVIFTGGNGSGAGFPNTGSGGGGAGNLANGGNAVNNSGTGGGLGGNAGGGQGANGVSGLSAPGGDGLAGTAPGGGGSGSARNTANTIFTAVGGAGGAGSVLLTFTVDTGVTKYVVTSDSSSNPVGAFFNVTITAKNNSNATVPDIINPVTMSSPTSGSLMEFDWNSDGIYGDNSGILDDLGGGVKTIRARNKKAQTVDIVADAGPITTPVPLSMTTTATAFSKLQIVVPGETAAAGTDTGKTGTPTNRAVGGVFDVTVNAVDQFWNLIDTVTDTVSITSLTDTIATLPADAPLVAGTVLQSVTFNTPGTQTLTASDLDDPSKTANTSANITVTAVGRTWAATNGNLWDTTSENWVEGDFKFADLNAVNFNSNVVTSFVDINGGTVAPFSILVNATSAEYEFSNGSITGVAGGLTKAQAGTLILDSNNTYTGPTTVNGGLLRLKNVNALPVTSALTLNTGILGLESGDFTRSLGTAPGEVVLTGAAGGFAAFEADHFVNLGGTGAQVTWGTGGFFNAGGNMTLGDATSSNTIDFRNSININGEDRTITVPDGGADLDAILSGAITNSGANKVLSKTGNGTLMLTGVNAWGNELRILGGNVMLGGNSGDVIGATSNVQLGGNGTVGNLIFDLNGRSETIANLNLGGQNTSTPPGDSDNQHSVINSGGTAVLTLSGLTYYAAASPAQNQNGQATVSANIHTGTGDKNFTVYDSLLNSGALVEELIISGALTGASITKLEAGGLVLTNPLYSGNTTVSAGSLIVRKTGLQTNANPNNDVSTVTIAETGAVLNLAYSGTDTVGAVTIGATTYTSGILAGFAGPGITQVPQITGTGTLTVVAPPTDPFLAWADNNPGVLFNGDENNDGVKNGLAWLLGAANPGANANSLLPVVSQIGGSLKMTFKMRPASARDGARLLVEHSSNLGMGDPWSTGVLVPDASAASAPLTFTVGGTDPLDVVIDISSTEAAAGKLFGRLRAER